MKKIIIDSIKSKFIKRVIKVNLVIANISAWTIIFYRLHWIKLVNEITNVAVENTEFIMFSLFVGIGTRQIYKNKK